MKKTTRSQIWQTAMTLPVEGRVIRDQFVEKALQHWIGLFAAISIIAAVTQMFLSHVATLVFFATAAFALFPALRPKILFLATIAILFLRPSGKIPGIMMNAAPALAGSFFVANSGLGLLALSVALGFSLFAILIKRIHSNHFFRRNAFFAAIVLGLIGLSFLGPTANRGQGIALASGFFCYFAVFIWYFGYDLQHVEKGNPQLSTSGQSQMTQSLKNAIRKLAFYRPFWNLAFMIAPLPRGESTIKVIEAKDRQQLLQSQRKGLILVVWALAMLILSKGIGSYCFGTDFFGRNLSQNNLLPSLSEALDNASKHQYLGISGVWKVIFAEFFQHLSLISAWGHLIIGIARFSGYLALRNTYRPLSSTNFNEFFNRYNYYYKELLVQLFYYPAFFGWAKRLFPSSLKLRAAASVFFAAGVANFVIHIFLHVEDYLKMPFCEALAHNAQYGFYCFCLAAVVASSQINQLRTTPFKIKIFTSKRFTQRKYAQIFDQVISVFIVITFYAVLRIFDDGFNGSIKNNFSFALSAIGVHF